MLSKNAMLLESGFKVTIAFFHSLVEPTWTPSLFGFFFMLMVLTLATYTSNISSTARAISGLVALFCTLNA